MPSPRDPRPVSEVIAAEGVAKAIGLKHVASVLYTYRCNIACRHCLFNCSPVQPDVHVRLEDGLEFLRQLHQTDRVIHIAGGEALIYTEDVLELCRAADDEGIAPHFIETNGKVCEDDADTRRCFESLRDAGVKGLFISADPYHQPFVPPENRLRAFRVAVELFGRENVSAADLTRDQLEEMKRIGTRRDLLAEHVRHASPQLVGRAGNMLARFLPRRPIEELAGDALWHRSATSGDCAVEFDPDTMWEIHIDPYGNVQTCCGIIVGNVHQTPLPELITKDFHTGNELVRRVYERGPYGLLELAIEKGFAPAADYAQKCHLCWEVRKFLRPFYPDTLGPAEIYELPAAGRSVTGRPA